MGRFATRISLLGLALWWGAVLLPVPGEAQVRRDAGGSPGQAGHASIYSADRRFMVSGMTSAENMVLAGHLAELAEKVEAITGGPLPMERDQILGVMVQSSSAPDAEVLMMQGWDDGRFYQRLVVPGRLRMDGEDLMEGVCWLLLNRHAAEHTPPAQRTGMGATVPDWVSAGLAQNTQAALKSRNRDWIARELADGRVLPLAQVVKQELLPPGRWREKAYAAAAVEFLFPDGEADAWAALFQANGRKDAIDPAWLRRHCPALAERNPEAAWREHLAAQARRRTVEAWTDRSLQIEERLLQTLNFQPRALAAEVPPEVPQELFARDLIAYRGQGWTPAVASALSLQMQNLKLGAPPILQDVLSCYAAFFDQLSTPPAEKTHWWRKRQRDPARIQPPDDATWKVALSQLWQRAERAHQQFLEQHQTRKRYVDGFDRPESGGFGESDAAAEDLPRTRWQRYVDEVEDQFQQNPEFTSP